MVNIFLDDERFPPCDGREWMIVRNFDQFKELVEQCGRVKIKYVSFDHDLGATGETGMHCAKYLINADLDIDVLARDFSFYVHSQNPVGAENIRCIMDRYIAVKNSII